MTNMNIQAGIQRQHPVFSKQSIQQSKQSVQLSIRSIKQKQSK